MLFKLMMVLFWVSLGLLIINCWRGVYKFRPIPKQETVEDSRNVISVDFSTNASIHRRLEELVEDRVDIESETDFRKQLIQLSRFNESALNLGYEVRAKRDKRKNVTA